MAGGGIVTRRQSFLLLLSGLNDFQAAPKGMTASWKVKRGEAPSRRITCPDCNGEQLRDRFKRPVVCERCHDRRFIVVDSYTSREVGTEQTAPVRRVRSVMCDGCAGSGVKGRSRCPYCDGTG